MNSGSSADHGVWIGFIDNITFEGIPDASQWAITNPALSTGGAYMMFDGLPAAKVTGSSVTVATHTPRQHTLSANDDIQLGVKDNLIEMTIYDDSTKSVIYSIWYANVGNVSFAGTIFHAITTNHITTLSHRLSPNIYRGTQIPRVTYATSSIRQSSYAQYNTDQRGELMYNTQHIRPLPVSNGSIVTISTVIVYYLSVVQ